MYDPCGRASGSYKATPGKGEYTNTTFAKLGDLGSQVLPKYDIGTVWEAGSVVETMISFRATHGKPHQLPPGVRQNTGLTCVPHPPVRSCPNFNSVHFDFWMIACL